MFTFAYTCLVNFVNGFPSLFIYIQGFTLVGFTIRNIITSYFSQLCLTIKIKNNLQFYITLNDQAMMLGELHSEYWHGMHLFFRIFDNFKK
jgi:hypothetical protein